MHVAGVRRQPIEACRDSGGMNIKNKLGSHKKNQPLLFPESCINFIRQSLDP